METTNQPQDINPQRTVNPDKQVNAPNPKKPGNDPDQTPNREVESTPKAKPQHNEPQKTKPGFKQ